MRLTRDHRESGKTAGEFALQFLQGWKIIAAFDLDNKMQL